MNKKIIPIVIALVFILQNSILVASPQDYARKYIESSLAAAKEDANYLVIQDFEKILWDITLEVQKDTSSQTAPLLEMQKQLEEQSQLLAIINPDNLEIVQSDVDAIWDKYKEIVRNRFALSFKIQNQVEQSNQIFATLQNLLESYQGVCKRGRGTAGINYSVAPISQTRGLQYNINIGYEYGQNGSGFKSSIETYTQTGEDKNRLTTGQALYTAASLNASIAFSGGSGLMVSGATAINPYLLAAAVVYGVVSHFKAAEDQARLGNEIVAANS